MTNDILDQFIVTCVRLHLIGGALQIHLD